MIRNIEHRLAFAKNWSNLADPVLRVATSLIFIIGGMGHFGESQVMLDRMQASPWRDVIMMVGDPLWLLWLSGAVFILCGIGLALGWMTRICALAIFFTLIPITVTIHFAPGHVGPLFKNVAILGALAYIFIKGPGRYSIDERVQSGEN